MEELSQKRDEWNKQQREIVKREQKSVRDFDDVSYASELYQTVTKTDKEEDKLDAASEPTLSDYYHPSEEQRKYEYLFIVLGMGVCFYASSQLCI